MTTLAAVTTPVTLLGLLKGRALRLGLGSLLLLATNGLEKAIPWLLKLGVDAFTADSLARVKQLALWVVGLAAVMLGTRTCSRIVIFNVGRDVEFDLRARLLAKLHTLGAPFVVHRSVGDIMSRATNDLGQVRLLLGFGGLNLVNAVVAYVSALGLMLAISPKLTFYALLPYPAFFLLARVFVRRLYRASQASQDILGKLAQRAQEYLSGVRVVRAFAADAAEVARFEETNRLALSRSMDLVRLRAMMLPIMMGITSVGTLMVLYVGGSMVSEGTLTKGEMLAFYAYLAQLVWPTMAAGYMLAILQRGRAAFERIREVLDATPAIVEDPEARKLEPSARGRSLDVRGLRFAYDGREVLHDVSFSVGAGKRLAIVGKTGSGKTTLANLLARLLPTPHGAVYLDGTDICGLRLRDLRRAVGYAQQDPFLFSTTVGRNVGFTLEAPDGPEGLARIREACEQAVVWEDISRLPHGIDTVVGERGVQLSGGQKQRVALARAILNEPSVLVLDDPLSAVDAKTEHAILDALDALAGERTLVLITNRATAAARCDEIVLLDAGRIVERGSHAVLMEQSGPYAALYLRQTLEQELSAL